MTGVGACVLFAIAFAITCFLYRQEFRRLDRSDADPAGPIRLTRPEKQALAELQRNFPGPSHEPPVMDS